MIKKMRVFASNEESAEDRACPCPVGADLRRVNGWKTERTSATNCFRLTSEKAPEGGIENAVRRFQWWNVRERHVGMDD